MHINIECAKDLFHEKMLADGEPINAGQAICRTIVIQMIRKDHPRPLWLRSGQDENVRDACIQLCLENQYDPVWIILTA